MIRKLFFILVLGIIIIDTAGAVQGWNSTKISTGFAPVFAVDKNNVVHIAWKTGTSLYYANSSSNWRKIEIVSGTVSEWGNAIPAIYTDNNNIVYVAWVDTRNEWTSSGGSPQGYDIYFAKSDDGWVHNLATNRSNLLASKPQIAVDLLGDIHLVYERETTANYPYMNQIFHVNKNSGWTEQQVSDYPFPGVGTGVRGPSMIVDKNGIIHVAYFTGDQIDHIRYANSSTGWVNIQVDGNASGNWWDDRINPAITVDSYNNVYVIWEDARNTDTSTGSLPNRREIYYATSSNGWMNTEIALPIDAGLEVKSSPSIVIDSIGTVHVSWLHRNQSDSYSNLYYSNSSNWNDAIHITNIPSTCPFSAISTQNALAVDNNGIVHAVWADSRNGNFDVYYAASSSTFELSEPVCTTNVTSLNNTIGYSALVATGQNTFVQSSNGTFGLLLKGQSKTINNSIVLNNIGDISARVEARFNDSIGGVFGLVSGANVLNATNFALGLPSSLMPLNNSGADVQIAVAPPGVTALDARLGVPGEQAFGEYGGTVVLTFSNNV